MYFKYNHPPMYFKYNHPPMYLKCNLPKVTLSCTLSTINHHPNVLICVCVGTWSNKKRPKSKCSFPKAYIHNTYINTISVTWQIQSAIYISFSSHKPRQTITMKTYKSNYVFFRFKATATTICKRCLSLLLLDSGITFHVVDARVLLVCPPASLCSLIGVTQIHSTLRAIPPSPRRLPSSRSSPTPRVLT